MSKVSVLPMDVEKSITTCKEQIFEREKLRESFPNTLLREDVLELLDRFCTVVYFPLKREENNGFHITGVPFADGSKQHFVFINTAQTMEKQVFTAAHELGHIWHVDDYVIKDLGLDDTAELREMIINRFAAVLLIPGDIFDGSVDVHIKEYGATDKTITIKNLLKVIVVLMNQFFVPMKSIVLRLVERNFFSPDVADILLGNAGLSKEVIDQQIQSLITEFGFIKFQTPSMKKWIEGLAENLDLAEKNHLVSQAKIDHMREKFDLQPPASTTTEITTEMGNILSLVTQEGIDKE